MSLFFPCVCLSTVCGPYGLLPGLPGPWCGVFLVLSSHPCSVLQANYWVTAPTVLTPSTYPSSHKTLVLPSPFKALWWAPDRLLGGGRPLRWVSQPDRCLSFHATLVFPLWLFYRCLPSTTEGHGEGGVRYVFDIRAASWLALAMCLTTQGGSGKPVSRFHSPIGVCSFTKSPVLGLSSRSWFCNYPTFVSPLWTQFLPQRHIDRTLLASSPVTYEILSCSQVFGCSQLYGLSRFVSGTWCTAE